MKYNKNCNYKCTLSIGMRCFTEIFLKELNFKKFSGPFDAMFHDSINSIIYILKNKIKEQDLLYSENMKNKEFDIIHKDLGFRTMHKMINFFENDLIKSYHFAFLPHHNLNNNETKKHFNRCFERLEKIKLHRIKTLFCLFIHPNYGSDKDVSFNEIKILKKYLIENFHCDLLICKFEQKKNCNYKWKFILNKENLIYAHINNNSHLYNANEVVLKEIFSNLGVNEENLLTYHQINKLV